MRPRLFTAMTVGAVTLLCLLAGSVLVTPDVAAAERTLVVRSGDTLTGIAARYGTSIAAIVSANHLADANLIYVGQRLTIPGPASATPTARPASTPAPAATRTYVVRPGDHLTGIAARYGTSIAAIVSANHLADANLIYVGQRLTIPGPAFAAAGSGLSSELAALMNGRASVRKLLAAEANRQGVPVSLVLAVAWQESGWQQQVTSSAGAVGVMQLLPSTGAWVGQSMLGHAVNIHDVRANIEAGVRLLRHYLARYGTRALALTAYYQGQTSADTYGVLPVTQPYIASILALESMLR
jgi:LysM repeat protein